MFKLLDIWILYNHEKYGFKPSIIVETSEGVFMLVQGPREYPVNKKKYKTLLGAKRDFYRHFIKGKTAVKPEWGSTLEAVKTWRQHINQT